jgi:hypothetical protein
MISGTTARRIASEWHGGQSSALYAFASTGTILNTLKGEIIDCTQDASDDETDDLYALWEYVDQQGEN